MQFLFFCFIERQDGSVAVDVNGLVHGVVRDCGIVHGEREIVPASPQSIWPGVVDVVAVPGSHLLCRSVTQVR